MYLRGAVFGGAKNFFRQGYTVLPWLAWHSLCESGWSQTHKDLPVCLPSAGFKGMGNHGVQALNASVCLSVAEADFDLWSSCLLYSKPGILRLHFILLVCLMPVF